MTMRLEFLNRNGDPDMINISTYRTYLDEKGEIGSELVSVINNGKDVTQEERARLEKERAKDEAKGEDGTSEVHNVKLSLEESPFHPDNQERIQLTPVEEERTIDGITCRRFDYSLPLENNTRIGTAWLDIDTGAPVLHEFTTDPLPPRVKEMSTTVRFKYAPEGDFYTTRAVFEGVGGFLFIKKSFRGSMVFENYWEFEGELNAD